MNMLASLATSDDIIEEKDTLGGGSGPLDTAVYAAKVTLAYIDKAASGAMSLVLHLKTDQGRDLRQTLWMTSGTAKGGKNYYTTKDGEKKYLPGFQLANSLCLLTIGKEISELETEPKVVSVYSFETKSELPTKVDMLTDLIGQEIYAAVFRQTVDKNVKDGNGNYVPSGDTRDENEIDKFFRARDKMTVTEIRAQAETATFMDAWAEKWTGKTRNKAKGAAGAGTAGVPAAVVQQASKPRQSLFA